MVDRVEKMKEDLARCKETWVACEQWGDRIALVDNKDFRRKLRKIENRVIVDCFLLLADVRLQLTEGRAESIQGLEELINLPRVGLAILNVAEKLCAVGQADEIGCQAKVRAQLDDVLAPCTAQINDALEVYKKHLTWGRTCVRTKR